MNQSDFKILFDIERTDMLEECFNHISHKPLIRIHNTLPVYNHFWYWIYLTQN